MPAHPLDNPIWSALTTKQQHLTQVSALARKFPFEFSPLSALEAPTAEAAESLASIVPTGAVVALFLEQYPDFSPSWTPLELSTMHQMIYPHRDLPPSSVDFIELTADDVPEMIALATLTKPGPFDQRTREFGDYVGVRREGKLAAMAGQRLYVPGYREVSAVCTHPDHLGHGYARALMFEIMRRIIASGEAPFLHVRSANQRAIDLYHHLGFTTRRTLELAVLRRTAS
jgi:ribosomal protein S18 acetylase RimI-like enzyme